MLLYLLKISKLISLEVAGYDYNIECNFSEEGEILDYLSKMGFR